MNGRSYEADLFTVGELFALRFLGEGPRNQIGALASAHVVGAASIWTFSAQILSVTFGEEIAWEPDPEVLTGHFVASNEGWRLSAMQIGTADGPR